jgi:serine/threonine protein kinase
MTLTVTSKWAPPQLNDHAIRRNFSPPEVGSYFGTPPLGNQAKAMNFADWPCGGLVLAWGIFSTCRFLPQEFRMSGDKRVPANEFEAGVQIGDFKIERRLGSGGMGIVYVARQLSQNRLVALKVLGQSLTRDVDVSRFQREARAASLLKHPFIAQVFFIGQDEHQCYLAMELVDGISLRQVIDRLAASKSAETELDEVVLYADERFTQAKCIRFDDAPTNDFVLPTRGESISTDASPFASSHPLPFRLSAVARKLRTRPAHVRRCVEIIRDSLQALAYAHEHKLIHRDIKPDNLLLDRDKKIRLIDFGVARFFDEQSLTYTGQIVGTPIYMSPEQITGQKAIDARTDIYSMALVLYELLALKTPVEAVSRESVFRSIISKPLPPISWVNAAVPAELEAVIHRGAAKDPDARYASAADFAKDLELWLEGAPVSAPPYRFRLDDNEIIAARPGRVLAAGFFVVFVTVLGAFFFEFFALFTLLISSGGVFTPRPQTAGESKFLGTLLIVFTMLLGVAVPVGVALVTQSVLIGKSWARWLFVLAASIVLLICCLILGYIAIWAVEAMLGNNNLFISAPTWEFSTSGAPLAIPLLMGAIVSMVVLWALLSRKSSTWFAFAKRTRTEHMQYYARLQNE